MEFKIVVKTFQGLEELLLEECRELGLQNAEIKTRSVAGTGNLEILYKLNLFSRLGLKVLQEVAQFTVNNSNELYNGVKSIEWENYFSVDKTFAFDCSNNQSVFNNSMFVSQKSKDAVADYFREKNGKRPYVDPQDAEIRIFVHLYKDQCSVFLDSSGDPLFKRGYKTDAGNAPINEIIAAAMVKLSGYNGSVPLIDLFCGSGTIITEALMAAKNIYPAKFREKFCFLNWKNFDSELYQKQRDEGLRAENSDNKFIIRGIDNDSYVIKKALNNIRKLGYFPNVKLVPVSFKDYQNEFDSGIIISNPPYGKRIEVDKIPVLYNNIGSVLKNNFQNFDVFILSGSIEGLKSIGLKHSASMDINNGGIDCKFRKFEIYKGSKKIKSNIGE